MTDNKKLFPGVTQAQLDAEDRKKQKQEVHDAKVAEKQLRATMRAELLKKFGVDLNQYARERKAAIKGGVFGALMGVSFWWVLSFFVNGMIDSFRDKEVGGKEWTKSVVNPFVDGKFEPTGTWYRQLAFLIFSVCLAMGIYRVYGKEYRYDKQRVRAVDVMLELEKSGVKYDLNTREVKRLVEVVPFIIEGMAAEKRVYFDKLMNGEISIKDNDTFRNMAVAIMQGHLQSHPEDAALILDAFEEKSLPDTLLWRCRQLQLEK